VNSRVERIWAARSVLDILVKRDLRVRYARSFLGYAWTVLDPLAMALIYFVIFTQIFTRADPGHSPYFLFLLSGLLTWQWFNASVIETARALVAEAKLVRSTSVPRELWVIRVVIAKGIEYLFSLPVLLVVLAVYLVTDQTHLDWRAVLYPVGILLTFILCLGLGLILAPLTVMADDSVRVVRIVLRLMFYCTPIIYSIGNAPGWIQRVLWFNPLSGILEIQRAGFFGQPMHIESVVIGLGVIALIFVVGVTVFSRMENAVLKEI